MHSSRLYARRFHSEDGGWVVLRKNATRAVCKAEGTPYRGAGYLISIYAKDGRFIRFAGTWTRWRDAVEEARSLGYYLY